MYIRSILNNILENAGHTVCGEAETSEEALSKFGQLKPDLVTIDIIMSDRSEMNGIEVITKLKQIDPSAKILVISATTHRPYLLKAIKAGALDCICKPIAPNFVLKSIASLTEE
jgi:two-component system chemotaxis response regulator CheY